MHVLIAHNAVAEDVRADERDVLVQVEVVRQACVELGYRVEIVPASLNLDAFANRLRTSRPDVVFNLVESLAGSDRLAGFATAIAEEMGFPVTGSSAAVLGLSNDKTLTKARLRLANLPTPASFPDSAWERAESRLCLAFPSGVASAARSQAVPGNEIGCIRFILKPVGEHASLGMDDSAIVRPRDSDELARLVAQHAAKINRPCFAEQFIDGREFNVSLLASADGCEVLPLAEIDFSGFPPGKTRIVDYKAKWDVESFEFKNTPRKFLVPGSEPDLACQLGDLARSCWHAFELGGYVRVDFRVDAEQRPWILEINTNPCLSPDAGYAAALNQAGITPAQAVERIVRDAMRPTRAPDSRGESPTVRGDDTHMPGKTSSSSDAPIAWRFEVQTADAAAVRELVKATAFFYADEIDIAEELVRERLEKGPASGYHFVLADIAGRLAGYACFGHIACSRDSFDLYWIAVHPESQAKGLGRQILEQAEKRIAELGGRRIYIETSNRQQYQTTRGFYLRCGYKQEALLTEFYGPGDDKVIYVRAMR